MDSLVFVICMHTSSLDKTYIYLEVGIVLMKIKSLCFFHIYKGNSYELHCLFQWFCWLHDSYTHIILIYSWFCFHELYMCFIDLECRWSCDLHVFYGIYSCFIPYLKNFVLVFKIILKLVFIFQLIVIFKHVKLFSNHIYENPYLLRAVG